MSQYQHIQRKLQGFIRKYYTNEMIRGSIFFVSFGLLYLFFTIVIEYFFWLEPGLRTALFWMFVSIEFLLLFRFVLLPLFKLFGIRKGISEAEASRIIGRHFSEVSDKLTNLIQLKSSGLHNELLEASIEQKSSELSPIKFKKAIVFKRNKVYLKYLALPIIVWLLVWLTGKGSLFTQSLNRVVHHQTAFAAPAPFYFEILNKDLQTVQDQSYTLKFRTVGDIIPENIKIVYEGNSYYVAPGDDGQLSYTFDFPVNDIEFYMEGNSVRSNAYKLKVIAAPKITGFSMQLNYPRYLNKISDTINNTGNAIVPEGTEVKWVITSQNTSSLDFSFHKGPEDKKAEVVKMKEGVNGNFSYSKRILKKTNYEIRSSNDQIRDFETLGYQLDVVKDEYPKIFVQSDIDSVSRGPVQFSGQLTDDYGISRLQIVAKALNSGKQSMGQINTGKNDFEEFFYIFPEGIILDEGEDYEIYFEVFDNDAIKGPKKAVSRTFTYRNKTSEEEDIEILEEQRQGIERMENAKDSGSELKKSLEEFSKKLRNKEDADWNDQKELEEFVKRQKSYQKMIERNADKMKDNLDEMDLEEQPLLHEKREELKERWEEMSDYKEKEELLKELERMAEKLQKEDLLEKIDKLKEQNKQETRTLERILELTKQFYVEKKSVQIMEKLQELSEEQLDLSTEEINSSEEQEKLNSKFDSLRSDFEELRKQNETLKQPMEILDSEPDEKLIQMDMKDAEKSLEESERMEGPQSDSKREKAKEQQRRASDKMKELSKKMESGLMEMEMQGVEENIEDLQQILKNLLRFSLDQEALMISFENISSKNADYPEKMKEQIKLKDYFEHIDDSLYALSLRMVKLTSEIQEDLGAAHYNLDKSLENIAENRIQQGRSNQQYTMTAANSLADLLSDMLESLQNMKPGSGSGKGKEGELSLPDVIKKQQGMMERMKQGLQGKKGEGKQGKESMSGEQFQMYQEQKMLKDQLKEFLDKEGRGSQAGKSVLNQMEELEKILLEKGITRESLERMQKLEHELLELENASLKRNQDNKRKSETNDLEQEFREIEELKLKRRLGVEDEILRRKSLELSPEFKRKVKRYFDQE